MQIRARALGLLAQKGTTETFTVKSLSEELECSPSATSSLVSQWLSASLLQTDKERPAVRNSYAGYIVNDSPILQEVVDDEDDLHAIIREELYLLSGKYIDARTLATKLGYSVKYAGLAIADYLESLESNGVITLTTHSQDRSQYFEVTERGLAVIRSMTDLYAEMDNPSGTFRRRGYRLAESIRKDPTMVKRILNRTPTKRGQRKSTSSALRTDIPAVMAIASQMTSEIPMQTSMIQKNITGTSRTATARLLKKAAEMGLLVRVKNGREYLWMKPTPTVN